MRPANGRSAAKHFNERSVPALQHRGRKLPARQTVCAIPNTLVNVTEIQAEIPRGYRPAAGGSTPAAPLPPGREVRHGRLRRHARHRFVLPPTTVQMASIESPPPPEYRRAERQPSRSTKAGADSPKERKDTRHFGAIRKCWKPHRKPDRTAWLALVAEDCYKGHQGSYSPTNRNTLHGRDQNSDHDDFLHAPRWRAAIVEAIWTRGWVPNVM